MILLAIVILGTLALYCLHREELRAERRWHVNQLAIMLRQRESEIYTTWRLDAERRAFYGDTTSHNQPFGGIVYF